MYIHVYVQCIIHVACTLTFKSLWSIESCEMSFLLSGFLPGEGGAASSEVDVITRLVPPTYMYMYIANGERREGKRGGEGGGREER